MSVLASMRNGSQRGLLGRWWVGLDRWGVNVEPMGWHPERRYRRLRVAFAWVDLWVGAYIDRDSRTVYVCPLPTLLIAVTLAAAEDTQP